MIQRLYLILKEIAGGRFISVIVLLSVMLSVFSAGLFRVVGDSLAHYVDRRFASSIPPNTIRVSTRQPRSLFIFEVDRPKTTAITDRTIRRIRGMGGISDILPVSALKIPIQARVSYMGFNYRTDILAFGVPQRLVAAELAGKRYRSIWRDPAREKVIPVLIPRNILHSFNDGMAAPNGIPRISERGAVGFGFRLRMGRSSIRTLQGYEESDAVVAGFTDQVDSFALILPLDLVVGYNKKFIKDYRAEYQYAYVKVKDHPTLLRVSDKIRAMGLVVEAEKGLSRQIVRLKEAIGLLVSALQAIIVVIAIIAISFATVIAVLNRLEYYRTMRVIGSSRLFLTTAVTIKYSLIGFAGAWCGVKLLQLAYVRAAEYFHLTGIALPLSVPEETFRAVLIYGALIPVLSTVPALVRLYAKGLSRD
ncbi:MAG: hypothetical protein JW807_10630 [Spirochaetes bacterium]|nr:hypothetical protein [Spirochaetota bacterium]